VTVQWITDSTVGTQQVGLGLSDAELLQRCAGLDMSHPEAPAMLQDCKAQVAGANAEADLILSKSRGVKNSANSVASEIGKILDGSEKSAQAGSCSAASSSFSDAKDKFIGELQPKSAQILGLVDEAVAVPPQAFYDDHSTWVETEVGSISSQVHSIIEDMDNSLENTRRVVEACAGPTPGCPPGTRFDRSSGTCTAEPPPTKKKKKSGLGWGLLLLGGAALAAIVTKQF
jgi:hypothetical protein